MNQYAGISVINSENMVLLQYNIFTQLTHFLRSVYTRVRCVDNIEMGNVQHSLVGSSHVNKGEKAYNE
jgi:hypothetical protein